MVVEDTTLGDDLAVVPDVTESEDAGGRGGGGVTLGDGKIGLLRGLYSALGEGTPHA